MKVVKTQEELDKLERIDAGEEVVIKSALRLNCVLEVFGSLRIKAVLDCDRWNGRYIIARGNSSVVAWGNSSVEAWGNSSVVAWENSSVEAWENSSVVARGNSSVEAWGNSSVEAWRN
ncbi:MAG: hypothetical protein NUW09_05135, partial [Deltaproteobacteria bacterium]|nr:hypothetical protein [Deltaproteobacteria bacterium]